MAIQTAPLHSSFGDAPTADSDRATTGASQKTLLVLEAALSHSRFTEVVEATGLANATTHRIPDRARWWTSNSSR
jgi:IclR family transcriptional regulator, KDG regulon repressor